MNVDPNKALVRRVIEEMWNKEDLSVIPQVMPPTSSAISKVTRTWFFEKIDISASTPTASGQTRPV
jgi:hypothetical protein